VQGKVKKEKREECIKVFILVHPNLGLPPVLILKDEISLTQLVHNWTGQPLGFNNLSVPH